LFLEAGRGDGIMNSWKEFFSEGEQYFKTAKNGVCRKSVFTNEILYNIIGMSIEKYFMGFFQFHGKLPEHHTLESLASDAAAITEEAAPFIDPLKHMDSYQEVCHPELFQRVAPSDDDILEMLALNESIKVFVAGHTDARAGDVR